MAAPRYLFGPTTADFARGKLALPRAAGECLAFDADGAADLRFGPDESWAAAAARWPRGWQPDFVALTPAYTVVPAGIWDAPVPIVVLAVDWNLLGHQYREIAPRCELILTDRAGVDAFTAAGHPAVQEALLYGCGLDDLEGSRDADRDIDILFVGNLHPAVQAERLPWLARLARLAGRHVVIRSGVFGAEYRGLLRRARIAFNRSIRGECNMRVFEAAAAGALLFQEADNRELPALFADRRECVYYRDDTLEPLLDYYLDHEAERAAIAAAARARAPQFRFDRLLGSALAKLDLSSLQAARRRRSQHSAAVLRGCERLTLPAARRTDSRIAGAIADPVAAYLAALLEPPGRAADQLTNLLERKPDWAACRLALAEVHAHAGRTDLAVAAARTALEQLERCGPGRTDHAAASYPPRFDALRVEWERAGWRHAGDAAAEGDAKCRLLRWRLLDLLAAWTGDRRYAEAALAAAPDFPPAHSRLGTLLLQAGEAAAAVPSLRAAAAADPFNAARAADLAQALERAGALDEARAARTDWTRIATATAAALRPAPPPTPSRPTTPRPRRIVWEGGFHSLHSYAHVNRAIAQQLALRGHDVALRPTDSPNAASVHLGPILNGARRNPTGPADVRIRHAWPPRLDAPPEGRFVLIQPWELGRLPTAWAECAARTAAEVWAYSHAVRDCYIASGVPASRVHVVPLGVDPDLFHPQAPPLPLATRKRFKFLFVGGTIRRKGFDLLLEAFGRAFTAADDAALVVQDVGSASFYAGFGGAASIEAFRARPGAPEIEYRTRPIPAHRMAGLYTACDCLVLPFRGEGFGLPIAEAMACGRPAIVTDASPATDFCTAATAYFVRAVPRQFATPRVGTLDTVGLPWLWQPDIAALAAALRRAADDPTDARRRGSAAADRIRTRWTWDHTAAAIEQRLEHLTASPPASNR